MSTKRETPYVAPFSHRLFAGGIAGVCEILVMYPTDVVRLFLIVCLNNRLKLGNLAR